MMEILVYPVSAVLQFWHWLLADVLGAPVSGAWIASIILLVITVRGAIAPFSWKTYKVGRTSYMMRPHMKAIADRYGSSTALEDIEAEREAIKKLRSEHGYNPLAGCVPAMIQLPFFFGLYRLLYWLAVPDVGDAHRIGLLTPDEIESFRSTTLFDVPLPAYVSMTPEQFASLGTTVDAVRSLAIPMLIAAICFTSINLLLSQIRNRTTLEWENAFTRGSYRFLYWMIPFIALSLTTAGLLGLVPIALLLYWVVNNFWTASQTVLLWALLVKRFPSEEIHRNHVREAREAYVEKKREKRERKRAWRRKKAGALVRPTTIPAVRRDIRAEKSALAEAKRDEKRAKKAIEKERSKVQREAKSNSQQEESQA